MFACFTNVDHDSGYFTFVVFNTLLGHMQVSIPLPASCAKPSACIRLGIVLVTSRNSNNTTGSKDTDCQFIHENHNHFKALSYASALGMLLASALEHLAQLYCLDHSDTQILKSAEVHLLLWDCTLEETASRYLLR